MNAPNFDLKLKILTTNPIFTILAPETLQKAARESRVILLQVGDTLLQQHTTAGSGLYIVIEGRLCALVQYQDQTEQVIGWLSAGDYLGEIELLTGQPRTATIKADTLAQVLFLPRETFETLSQETPALIPHLGTIAHQRLRRMQLFRILPRHFGPLTPEKMTLIETAAEWVTLKNGEQLVAYQDSGSDFYIVVTGRVQARIPNDQGVEQPIADIYAGESVGEMGFFTEQPRSASVYAMRDSELVRFSKDCFFTIQSHYPEFTFQFAQQVITRLRRTVKNTPVFGDVNICLIAADPAVPLRDFARELSSSLTGFTTCQHLNPQVINTIFNQPNFAQLPQGAVNEIRLSSWLDEQEQKFTHLVYEADPTQSNWTWRCLEHADQIILVARAGTIPDLPYLRWLVAPHELDKLSLTLVVLHENASQFPRHTARWLDPLPQIKKHYHIRTSQPSDYQRLARRLTKRAIGLALGGGGARGFAHIGVLRAFEERGIPVDVVGGTSIGALVGAGCALGMDSEALYAQARGWVREKRLLDYTLPFTSILAARSLTGILKTLFGNTQIEDTWLTYFCVTANLTTAQPMIHQRGPLWKYTRASSALPPIFPPVKDGNSLLADGVLANNLPVDIMRELCEGGRVIGVDVSAEEDLTGDYDLETSLSGWQVLCSRLLPFYRRLNTPNIFNIVMRVAEFSSVRLKHAQYQIPDLMIRPAVEKVKLFQLGAIDDIVELGYQAGAAALENWRE